MKQYYIQMEKERLNKEIDEMNKQKIFVQQFE